MKIYHFLLFLLPYSLNGQSIGIGTTTPDSSATLDISSTNGGILIPRLTENQRNAINEPATGLLLFNSDSNRFEYFNGVSWTPINTDGNISSIEDVDGDTNITTEAQTDEDTIRITIQAQELIKIDNKTFHLNNAGNGISIGLDAGKMVPSTDNWNTLIGYKTGKSMADGISNVAIGVNAAKDRTSGDSNVLIGAAAGEKGSGDNNTVLGATAGIDIGSGENNSYIGTGAGFQNQGSNNIAIGFFSSSYGLGESNIAIGRNTLNNPGARSELIAIGDSALHYNGIGATFPFQALRNTAVGSKSLLSNRRGSNNTGVGFNSLRNNTFGINNTSIGSNSGSRVTSGANNTSVGSISMLNNVTGNGNTAIGSEAGKNTTGDNNTFLGQKSGANNQGSGNVFIGSQSGENTDGNNQLIISNSSTTSPLIEGDFSEKNLTINGELEVATQIVLGAEVTMAKEGAIKYDSLSKVFFGYDGEKWIPLNQSNVIVDNLGKPLPFQSPMNNDHSWQRIAMNDHYIVAGGFTEFVIYTILNDNILIQNIFENIIPNGIGIGHSTRLGMSVDIADSTIVVGAPGLLTDWQNGVGLNTGGVCIYALNGTNWELDTCMLVPNSTDFGSRVAIDDNTIIASDDVFNVPVYVFDKIGSEWHPTVLYANNVNHKVLAIDISGNRAGIVIEEMVSSGIGQRKILIYKKVNGIWNMEQTLNVDEPSNFLMSQQISMNDDGYLNASFILQGNEIFVANVSDSTRVKYNGTLVHRGEVLYFKETSGNWNLEQKISSDQYGDFGLPIKYDGKTLAIGSKDLVNFYDANGGLNWRTIFYTKDPSGLWTEINRHMYSNIKALSENKVILELRRRGSALDDHRLFTF